MEPQRRRGAEVLDCEDESALTGLVIGAAIEVHRELGPGLLESIYEEALCYELSLEGVSFERQVALPLWYKGKALGDGYKMDLLIERQLVIELKTVETILPTHEAQLLSYLKLGSFPLGLLLNFKAKTLRQGIRRLANSQ